MSRDAKKIHKKVHRDCELFLKPWQQDAKSPQELSTGNPYFIDN